MAREWARCGMVGRCPWGIMIGIDKIRIRVVIQRNSSYPISDTLILCKIKTLGVKGVDLLKPTMKLLVYIYNQAHYSDD